MKKSSRIIALLLSILLVFGSVSAWGEGEEPESCVEESAPVEVHQDSVTIDIDDLPTEEVAPIVEPEAPAAESSAAQDADVKTVDAPVEGDKPAEAGPQAESGESEDIETGDEDADEGYADEEDAVLKLGMLGDISVGESFTVSVSYSGTGSLSYKWQRIDESLLVGSMTAGEVEALWETVGDGETLKVDAYIPKTAYRCVVSDGEAEAVSTIAHVLRPSGEKVEADESVQAAGDEADVSLIGQLLLPAEEAEEAEPSDDELLGSGTIIIPTPGRFSISYVLYKGSSGPVTLQHVNLSRALNGLSQVSSLSQLKMRMGDTSIATVKNCQLKGKAPGSTTLYVWKRGESSSTTFDVTVRGVVLNYTKFNLFANGDQFLFRPVSRVCASGVRGVYTFKSSNPAVAKVNQFDDNQAYIIAGKTGTATITVTNVDDTDIKDTCKVTVTSRPKSIKCTPQEVGISQSDSGCVYVKYAFNSGSRSDSISTLYEYATANDAFTITKDPANKRISITPTGRGTCERSPVWILAGTGGTTIQSEPVYVTVTPAVASIRLYMDPDCTVPAQDMEISVGMTARYYFKAFDSSLSPALNVRNVSPDLYYDEGAVTASVSGNCLTVKGKKASTERVCVRYSSNDDDVYSDRVTLRVVKAPKAFAVGKKTINVFTKNSHTALQPLDIVQLAGIVPQYKGTTVPATLSFTSSNKKVLKVGKNTGLLEPKKAGTAKITVKAQNGKKTVITVKVLKAPTSIQVKDPQLTICAGDTKKINYAIKSSAKGCTVKAGSVSDAGTFIPFEEACALVEWNSKTGMTITPNETGIGQIVSFRLVAGEMARGADGADSFVPFVVSEPVQVEICEPLAEIRFAEGRWMTDADQLELSVGMSCSVNCELLDASGNATAGAYLTGAASGNKKLVTAKKAGNAVFTVKAVKAGETAVTVSGCNGVQKILNVRVVAAPSKLTADQKTLTIAADGGSVDVAELTTLTALDASGNAVPATLKYKSSAPKVVKVSAAGVLTPVKPGKATITVTTQNGKTVKLSVQVEAAPEVTE